LTSELGGSLREVRPGRRLHVAVHPSGAATTLFFVHGAGGNKAQWRFQWEYFSGGGYNLVAWDAIGHGKSPQPRSPQAYLGAELLADARALFARHRTARNIIVAHSLGVRSALAWLIEERSGVDAAVLLGAAPIGPIDGSKRAVFGAFLGRLPYPLLELARPLLARQFRARAWDTSADPALVAFEDRATRGNKLWMMQALMSGASAIDPAALGDLTLPVQVLAGASDRLVPAQASRTLAALLPNAALSVLPQCGHQIMLEKPVATNHAIVAAAAQA
jgi:abhydrolase domain-containing protein 8